MSNHTQCNCNLECDHHKGELCSNKATFSFEVGEPCSFCFCEKCFPEQCPNCEGRGKIPIEVLIGSGEDAGVGINHKTCQKCNGTGAKQYPG